MLQLRHLRDTVPRLVDPMLVQQPSPEELYVSFSKAVNMTTSDVKGFSSLIDEDRNREILEKAKEGRAQTEAGISGWKVTDHEDWLDIPPGIPIGEGAADEDSVDKYKATNGVTLEDLGSIFERFLQRHPGTEGSHEKTSSIWKVNIPSAFK